MPTASVLDAVLHAAETIHPAINPTEEYPPPFAIPSGVEASCSQLPGSAEFDPWYDDDILIKPIVSKVQRTPSGMAEIKSEMGDYGPQQAFCIGCPLLQQCMTFGLRYESLGTWGLTRAQRKALGGVTESLNVSSLSTTEVVLAAFEIATDKGIPAEMILDAMRDAAIIPAAGLPHRDHEIWSPTIRQTWAGDGLPRHYARILTALADGPATIEQIAARTGISENYIREAINGVDRPDVALTNLGIVERGPRRHWQLTTPLDTVDWEAVTAIATSRREHVAEVIETIIEPEYAALPAAA